MEDQRRFGQQPVHDVPDRAQKHGDDCQLRGKVSPVLHGASQLLDWGTAGKFQYIVQTVGDPIRPAALLRPRLALPLDSGALRSGEIRVNDIAGVAHASRLEAQHFGFLLSQSTVFHAGRNHQQLARM